MSEVQLAAARLRAGSVTTLRRATPTVWEGLALSLAEDVDNLLAEVQRLRAFESIVSWRYGDTTDGRAREDMIERAARAFYESTDCRVDPALRTNWGHLAEKSPDVAESYRRHMRVALDAALGTQEGA